MVPRRESLGSWCRQPSLPTEQGDVGVSRSGGSRQTRAADKRISARHSLETRGSPLHPRVRQRFGRTASAKALLSQDAGAKSYPSERLSHSTLSVPAGDQRSLPAGPTETDEQHRGRDPVLADTREAPAEMRTDHVWATTNSSRCMPPGSLLKHRCRRGCQSPTGRHLIHFLLHGPSSCRLRCWSEAGQQGRRAASTGQRSCIDNFLHHSMFEGLHTAHLRHPHRSATEPFYPSSSSR